MDRPSRSVKIMQALEVRDQERLRLLNRPPYETTKGTTKQEQYICTKATTVTVEYLDDNVQYICTIDKVKNTTTVVPGDFRRVKWRDGSFKRAKILKIGDDGKLTVEFAVDKRREKTCVTNVENCNLQEGDIRLVKWSDGKFYQARILEIDYPTPQNPIEDVTNDSQDTSNVIEENTIKTNVFKETPDGIDDSTITINQHNTPNPVEEIIQTSTIESTIKTTVFKETPDAIDDNTITINQEKTPNPVEEKLQTSTIELETPKSIEDSPPTSPNLDNITPKSSSEYESSGDENEDRSENELSSIASDNSQQTHHSSEPKEIDESYHESNTLIGNCESSSENIHTGVVVCPSTNTRLKRMWDKRQCCIYCKRLVTKLPRHFQQMHAEEKEVVKFLSLPAHNELRKKILDELRSAGNFIHNSSVIENKLGTIIPKRRVQEQRSPSKLIPCTKCSQFISKKTLYKHFKKCQKEKKSSTPVDHKRKTALGIAKFMLPNKKGRERYVQLFQNSIIDGMKKCAVRNEIEKDELIMKFGVEQLEQFEHQPSQVNTIRNRLRELGRLMIEVKKISKVTSLAHLIRVEHFDTLISATKNLAGFQPTTNTFQTPSIATKIGETIKKCAAICKKNAIIEKNVDRRNEIDDYFTLLDCDWAAKISIKARATLYTAKFNRGNQLPNPEDMSRLNAFISKERIDAMKELAQETNASNYSRLAKIALATITIFNRKRAGDTHNLTLENYIKGNRGNEYKDILKSLNDEERELVRSFTRIETRGKKGRKVPILLSPAMREMTELLLKSRLRCGVTNENRFLFAIPGTKTSYFRGSDVIRLLRRKAKVEDEKRITTTAMRKEAATLSAACGLSEQQVDLLANFLGHTNAVHRQHYRLPEATLEKAKVGKFLQDIEKGPENNVQDTECASESLNAHRTHPTTPPKKKAKKEIGKPRRMWREDEEKLIKEVMGTHLILKTLPGKKECTEIVSKYPLLRSREWQDIKFKVKNLLSKN